MTRPFSLPLVLDTNWQVQDGYCEYVIRTLTVKKQCKLIVGAGCIFRIF